MCIFQETTSLRYKILARESVVSTVPTKDLVIALPYFGKLSLQICTRINCIMKNKLLYCNIKFVFQAKKIKNFFTFKDKIPSFLRSGIVYKFQCGGCNATYMAKLNVIFRSNFVSTLEFLHSLGKELKVMVILPLKTIFYSAITHLILKISYFLLPTTTTLKLR